MTFSVYSTSIELMADNIPDGSNVIVAAFLQPSKTVKQTECVRRSWKYNFEGTICIAHPVGKEFRPLVSYNIKVSRTKFDNFHAG